jgi:hypothetical protein
LNNALYFPYISIPRTPWLIQALLYWDRVASIVPREFSATPEKLQPHMRQLIADGMVNFIDPQDYMWRIPNFEENFIRILDSKPKHFWQSSYAKANPQHKMGLERIHSEKLNPRFSNQNTQIHADKLSPLIQELIERGLASPGGGKWYYIEEQVANYFMTYLAIGISREANYRPVSDKYSGLSAFSEDAFGGRPPLRSRLRARVLEEILPAPAVVEDFRDIYRFKERYNDQLKGFKRRIERFLVNIENLSYDEASEHVNDFIEEAREEKEEIARRMEAGRMSKITFNTLCSVCGSGAGLAGGIVNNNFYAIGTGALGIASQIWSIFRSDNENNIGLNPMAYAVYVQKKFTNTPKSL